MGRHKQVHDAKKPNFITARLSESDLTGLQKIQKSGEFQEMSSALRWCIHFSIAMLRIIPAAVIETCLVTETENDKMENSTEEVPDKTESKTK